MFRSLLKNSPLQGKQLWIGLFLYFSGIVTIGFGAVLTIHSKAGAGGYDALVFALSDLWNIPASYVIYFIAILAVLGAAFVRKSFPRISTFFTAFFLGLMVDFWKFMLQNIKGTSFVSSFLFLIIGIVFISFGVSAYLLSKLPANPIDDFVLSLTEKNLSLRTAKLSFDIPCFLFAILLGGNIGWGSIIITLSLGPIIQLWNNVLSFILSKFFSF